MSDAKRYNYATFPADDDVDFFTLFFEHLKPGEQGPEVELHDLESGSHRRLKDITGESALTVIELGSIT